MAADDHEIIITKGTSFSIQAKGGAVDLDDLRMLVNAGTLKIDYPYYKQLSLKGAYHHHAGTFSSRI